MAKRGFLSRHGIVRNAIREDLVQFAVPAFVVFLAGLVVSVGDGYDGLVPVLWNFGTQPGSLSLSAPNIVGLVLFVGGLTTALVAVGTLRRFYSSTLVTREDHQLITHGVYRFTRHPIYFGVIVVCMGVPVYASSWFGFATMSLFWSHRGLYGRTSVCFKLVWLRDHVSSDSDLLQQNQDRGENVDRKIRRCVPDVSGDYEQTDSLHLLR
jgi:protein-S-isoprenylcysteine O-methyltransferase Ste14